MRRRVGSVGLLALAVLLPLAFGACTLGDDESSGSTVAAIPTGTSAPPAPFLRACDTSVYGKLSAPALRSHSIRAGPLVFYYADDFAGQRASSFAPRPGRDSYYDSQKLLVLVRRGAVVTVAVPESGRRHATLLYDPAAWTDSGRYRLGEGESAVTFEACERGEAAPAGGPRNAMTQFNGGFVVARARCVPLEVLVDGEEHAIPVTLSFGAGHCV